MARKVAYQGAKYRIEYAQDATAQSPGWDFFQDLELTDKVKLHALFRQACDLGDFSNPEKFGDLKEGLFEFKSFQIRMPYAWAKNERGVLLITHGFIKKKNKTPKEEIKRTWRILKEDQERPRIAMVKKGK